MNKYFYKDGTEEYGPLDINELKLQKISKKTQVWCEGMTDWMRAGDVEELKPMFGVAVSSFSNNPYSYPSPSTVSKSGTTKIMVLFAVIGIAVAAGSSVFLLKTSKQFSNTKNSSVEKAANEFIEHLIKKEYSEAKKIATTSSVQNIDIVSRFDLIGKSNKPPAIEGMSCNVDGEKANCTYKNNSKERKIDLIKQDGQWLVDFTVESSLDFSGINNSE